ncbi:MAG: hypothetical protein WC082_11180 [Victivallales bacterium]
MNRLNIKEFHETRYCPAVWRDLMTDFLAFFTYHVNPYKSVMPQLKNAMEKSGCARIVDFAAGNGTYILKVTAALDPETNKYNALLCDKFPNAESARRIEKLSGGRIKYILEPVDILDENEKPQGFWTLFSGAHHLSPEQLRTFTECAVRQDCGIAFFEYSDRGILQALLPSLFVPFLVLLLTPLISPFSWRRLFWTYIIPVVPLLVMVDGFISHLKSYSAAEFENIVAGIDAPRYKFECGRRRILMKTCPITWFIGYPDHPSHR